MFLVEGALLAGVRQPFMTSSFVFLIKLKHASQKRGVSVTGTRGWMFSDFTRSKTWRLNSTARFMPYKKGEGMKNQDKVCILLTAKNPLLQVVGWEKKHKPSSLNALLKNDYDDLVL